jgi:hypothetical protein
MVNDGITVAKEIELSDPLENTGARLIQEVAAKTKDLAGDGTTTATIIAQALIKEGLKNVTARANPVALRRGLDKTIAYLVEEIAAVAKPIAGDAIAQVATVSSGNDGRSGTNDRHRHGKSHHRWRNHRGRIEIPNHRIRSSGRDADRIAVISPPISSPIRKTNRRVRQPPDPDYR